MPNLIRTRTLQQLKPSGKGVILRPEVASLQNHNRRVIETVRSNIDGHRNGSARKFGVAYGLARLSPRGALSGGRYRASPAKPSYKRPYFDLKTLGKFLLYSAEPSRGLQNSGMAHIRVRMGSRSGVFFRLSLCVVALLSLWVAVRRC